MATAVEVLEQIKGLLQEKNTKEDAMATPEVAPWTDMPSKKPDAPAQPQSSPLGFQGRQSPEMPSPAPIQPPAVQRPVNVSPPLDRPRGAHWRPWEPGESPPPIRRPAQEPSRTITPPETSRRSDLATAAEMKPAVERAQPDALGLGSNSQSTAMGRQNQELVQVMKELVQVMKDLKDELATLEAPGQPTVPGHQHAPEEFKPGGSASMLNWTRRK